MKQAQDLKKVRIKYGILYITVMLLMISALVAINLFTTGNLKILLNMYLGFNIAFSIYLPIEAWWK